MRKLSESVMPEDAVEKRWKEFLAAEAEIMKGLEMRGIGCIKQPYFELIFHQ
jgi:hypothetical protein